VAPRCPAINTGFASARSGQSHQPHPAAPHTLRGTEHFSWAVTTCDVDGDGRAEVAASAPGWCPDPLLTRGVAGCGRVVLIPAAGALVDVNAALSFDQNDAGVPNRAEERFGEHLSCADLNADGYGDLLIGSPGLNAPGDPGASRGGVFVYPGGPLGIDPSSPAHVYEEALGGGTSSTQSDLFGHLAAPVR
jgi:hypothetical protein